MGPRLRLLCVALAFLLVAAGGWYAVEGRYLHDFTGWAADELTAFLGRPDEDSRALPIQKRDYDVVGWYFFVGRQLIVIVQNGVVVRQFYGSK